MAFNTAVLAAFGRLTITVPPAQWVIRAINFRLIAQQVLAQVRHQVLGFGVLERVPAGNRFQCNLC